MWICNEKISQKRPQKGFFPEKVLSRNYYTYFDVSLWNAEKDFILEFRPRNSVSFYGPYPIFSDISERNNDYCDTLDLRSGGDRGGHVFRFGGAWLQIRNVNIQGDPFNMSHQNLTNKNA